MPKQKQTSEKNVSLALYILNITARLVAVCAVIALLVAVVHYFTADAIAENERRATAEAISRLYDGNEVTYTEAAFIIPQEQTDTVDALYAVTDASGASAGYCVKLSPTCFKGEVDLIAAFDPAGSITGVEIIATNDETSGIGTKVASSEFTAQFAETDGRTLSDVPDGYVIAGATKTSKPVSQSIIDAKKLVLAFLSGSEGGSESAGTPDGSAGADMETESGTETEAYAA